MSLQEVRQLSWRRFRVLFEGVFTWPKEEDDEPPARIADTVDWSKIAHTPVADLMSQFGGTRIGVGKEDG